MNAISQHEPQQLAGTEATSFQLVTFFVGEQLFGISALLVRDILRRQPLTEIPLSPKEIAGTMNLRGHIVTAIDLGSRLELPQRSDKDSYMCVVVEEREDQFCLLVDSVGDVLNADSSDLETNPASLNGHWSELSRGVLRLEDHLLIVLDTDKLLSF